MEFSDEESVTTVLTQESLPLFNGKRLTVKERTVNKVALQFKTQKSRKRKHSDSQQSQEAHGENKEMAPFLSEDLLVKLKSSLTVGGICSCTCIKTSRGTCILQFLSFDWFTEHGI